MIELGFGSISDEHRSMEAPNNKFHRYHAVGSDMSTAFKPFTMISTTGYVLFYSSCCLLHTLIIPNIRRPDLKGTLLALVKGRTDSGVVFTTCCFYHGGVRYVCRNYLSLATGTYICQNIHLLLKDSFKSFPFHMVCQSVPTYSCTHSILMLVWLLIAWTYTLLQATPLSALWQKLLIIGG